MAVTACPWRQDAQEPAAAQPSDAMDQEPDRPRRPATSGPPPRTRRLRIAAVLLGLALLGIVWESPALRLARLRRQVAGRGGQVFVASLQGRRQAFLLLDCRLDRLDLSGRGVRRERVLSPDFYPFAFCMGQSIRQHRGILEVELRMRALGSGGGNQGGGHYASGDGLRWRRL